MSIYPPENLSSVGVKQKDQADCGVACILTVLKYFGIEESHDRIRKLTGKTSTGSTLLGLKEALDCFGIQSDGYEATTLEQIKSLKFPAILHTLADSRYLHFIVLYMYVDERFIVFDPGYGYKKLTAQELDVIWKSKRLLLIESEPLKRPGSDRQEQKKNQTEERDIYSKLFSLFKQHQNFLLAASFLGVVISILSLTLALFSQIFIDSFINTNNGRLFAIVGLSCLALLIRCALVFARNYLLAIQSKSFNENMASNFLGKLMYLPLSFFESKSVGDLNARFTDTIRIQALITSFFGQTVIDFLILGTVTFFLLVQSFIAGSILLATIVLFILLSFSLRSRLKQAYSKSMASYGTSESIFLESVTGAETVKMFAKEKLFTSLKNSAYQILQNNFFTLNVFRIKISLLLDVISAIVIASIYWFSIQGYLAETMTLGELIAILQISLIIPSSLSQIFHSATQLQEAVTAYSRIDEITSLDPEESKNDEPLAKFESLVANNISFKYPGRTVLFQNISFEVKKGQILLLKGKSGKGKTTLFKILQKFYKPTSGSLFVDGRNWEEIENYSLRAKVAFVPQEIKIFTGDVTFNISLDPDVLPQDILDFCKHVGIHEAILNLPDGYNTILGEVGIKISAGQKQLIGFARALYKKPKLLLLDEATASMDAELETVIIESMKKILPETAVIVASHKNEWDSMATSVVTIF